MGHLLSSVNAEAAESLNTGTAEAPPPLPPIGSVVEYVMRPGHGRSGRNRFPAFVMGKSNHGSGLDLLVFIDAGDFIDEQMVERKRPGTEHHCWDFADDNSAAMRGIRATIASLHQRIGETEEAAAKLRRDILGDFNMPGLSLVDILARLEKRIIAIEAGDERPAPLPRSAPRVRTTKKATKRGSKRK